MEAQEKAASKELEDVLAQVPNLPLDDASRNGAVTVARSALGAFAFLLVGQSDEADRRRNPRG